MAQAPLWGLGKVIALEHPELWGGMFDLDGDATPHLFETLGNAHQDSDRSICDTELRSSEQDYLAQSRGGAEEYEVADRLLTEIIDSQQEEQIAWREGRRYVARLVPSLPKKTRRVSIRSDATYLITGGLGALGLKVAQWLVNSGAKNIVLTSRSGVSERNAGALAEIEKKGARVIVAQADVASEEDMADLFGKIQFSSLPIKGIDKIQFSLPPIKGIFHAAGVAQYQALKDVDLDTFNAILRPKVLGSWVLERLSADIELDFFVGFSSIASVWGSRGQGHYAAANTFIDAVAHYRNGLDKPATSINWGPWADGGMAIGEFQTLMTRMGVEALPPDKGLTALEYLLSTNSPQTVVADMDWTLFKRIYEARGARSLLAEIEVETPPDTEKERGSEILQQLSEASESDRHNLLTVFLQQEVGATLGLEASRLPELHRGFFDLGMDSLMVVELIKRLEKAFATSLSATLMFELPTIKDLVDYTAEEVLGWNTAKPELEVETESEPMIDIERLSEEEVEASIAAQLAQLEDLVGG